MPPPEYKSFTGKNAEKDATAYARERNAEPGMTAWLFYVPFPGMWQVEVTTETES